MELHFKGDALAFLPMATNFFEGGTSLSDIRVVLGGTRSQLKIISGIANIERGEMWMKEVAPHIHDINGKIELKEGTNQVNFVDLKASVKNKSITFNTVRDITLANGRELKHWYFNTLDLDFGIVSIRTEQGGVELNLPGLMTKEDAGSLYLTGKDAGEMFYFAGPVKHPLAYGAVTLYDARLTYPFLKSET